MDCQLVYSKKIKKNKKNNLKNVNKLPLISKYKVVVTPPKFLNPYSYYKLAFDIVLIEDQEIMPAELSALNYFKLVNGLEYTKRLNLLTINLFDAPNAITCPWGYLCERLKSLNNSESLEWAETIQENEKNNQILIESIIPFTSEKILKLLANNSQQKKEELILNYPTIIHKYCLNVSEFSVKSISLNEKAIQLMEYPLSLFRDIVITKGIPEIYPRLPKYCTPYFRKCLRKSIIDEVNQEFENLGMLTLKNGRIQHILWKPYHFYTFDDENQLILEILITWTIDSTHPLNEGTIPYPSIEKEIQTNSNEKQKIFELLSNNALGIKPKDDGKICTYRELQQVNYERFINEIRNQRKILFQSEYEHMNIQSVF